MDRSTGVVSHGEKVLTEMFDTLALGRDGKQHIIHNTTGQYREVTKYIYGTRADSCYCLL